MFPFLLKTDGNIFTKSKLFFPIHQSKSHWSCIVVFMKEKTIRFYDSQNHDGTLYLYAVFRYIRKEFQKLKGKDLCCKEWIVYLHNSEHMPKQKDSHNCGIFCLLVCRFIALGMPLCFSEKHMKPCRILIAASIMNKENSI